MIGNWSDDFDFKIKTKMVRGISFFCLNLNTNSNYLQESSPKIDAKKIRFPPKRFRGKDGQTDRQTFRIIE